MSNVFDEAMKTVKQTKRKETLYMLFPCITLKDMFLYWFFLFFRSNSKGNIFSGKKESSVERRRNFKSNDNYNY